MSKQNIIKYLKRVFKVIIILVALMVLVIFYANWKISYEAKPFIYDSLDEIPDHSVAIVLGTSKYIGKRDNIYFTNRINATKELYDAGKLSAIVVSGDNMHVSYNEPRDMLQSLVALNIPDSIIHLDYAGFRTLDSMLRMAKVFGQKRFIVVSQKFHNERAIFIARYYGYEAYGYNAKDLRIGRLSFKTKIRELFARVKVFIDVTIGTQPKFLGEPVNIFNDTIKLPE